MKYLIFLILPTIIFSQENVTDNFFNMMLKNKINQAFETLTYKSTLSDTDLGVQEIRKVKDLYLSIEENFGIITAYEKYQTKEITNRITLISYFSYHKYTPIVWKFLIYKNPNGEWILVNIQMNYNLTELIKNNLD